MQNLQNLIRFLVQSPLDFVIVGGFAAVLHGCNQTTRDIDICVTLSGERLCLIHEILKSLHPKHRTKTEKPEFTGLTEGSEPVKSLYLQTDFGVLDIISHVEGVGGYYDVLKNAEEIFLYGERCYLISLDDLIKSKLALGRHRDLLVVEELQVIKQKRK